MKTIVYATDFSENSRNALAFAYQLSRKAAAQLVVLHIYDTPTILNSPPNTPTFQELDKSIKANNIKLLEKFYTKNLGEEPMQNNIRFEARFDSSALKGIIAFTEEINPDLLVLGTKGASKLHEILMGSTAMGLIKKVTCPVLTVPYNVKYQPLTSLVFATDFEDGDVIIIKKLTEIAAMFNAIVTIVHVTTEKEYAGNEKMEWFKEQIVIGVKYPKLKFELLVSNDVYERLNSYLMENDIDLIAMFERKRESIFKDWFHKDLVKQIEFHVKVPLLSFNENYLDEILKADYKESKKKISL